MYFDFYDIASIEFIKRNLRKGDVFFDIGANVGYFSAIGANLVGETGEKFMLLSPFLYILGL